MSDYKIDIKGIDKIVLLKNLWQNQIDVYCHNLMKSKQRKQFLNISTISANERSSAIYLEIR